MIRRLAVLLALAAIGWFLYTRLRPRPAVVVGDEADLRPDEERGGFADRVMSTAADAAATARRVAQAPVEQVRSLMGDAADATPAGERVVLPEGEAQEGEPAGIAAGYTPADPTREPAPTPDAYRPAAEASPVAAPAPAEPQADRATEATVADAAATAARADDAAGEIKGNIRPDGEKIYHLPGDPAYERTKAEQTFTTVAEAEAAGFRRAGRRAE